MLRAYEYKDPVDQNNNDDESLPHIILLTLCDYMGEPF